MNDETVKIRKWLEGNAVFKISAIAQRASIPKGEMYHFLKDRRELPEKHYNSLKDILIQYGYRPLK